MCGAVRHSGRNARRGPVWCRPAGWGVGERRGAFTLIELLVVIAILVLLLSLLTPYMYRARQIARRGVCQSNFHTLGAAGHNFAAEHNGRGPGRAHLSRHDSDWGSSVSWANILNAEYFRSYVVQRSGTTPLPGKLYCPSMRQWTTGSARGHKWNDHGSGGGTYGKVLDPALVTPFYASYPRYLDYYSLGAILSRFPNPSDQILASEGERGNDNCPHGRSSPPYTARLGDNWSYPPWAASDGVTGGQLAFRHMLPNDVRLYQTRAQANYLYIDGHVTVLGPNDRVLDSRQYSIRP